MQDTNKSKLAARARRKHKDIPYVIESLNIQDSPNGKAYTRWLYCSYNLYVTDDNRVIGHYCKQRCCTICNVIRSQVRFAQYAAALIKQPMQFTTLTVPNCTIDQLLAVIKKLVKTFCQIRNTIGYRGNKIFGVFNLEYTINPVTHLLHPHIHILHSPVETFYIGKHLCNEITELHLKHHPDADYRAQWVSIVNGEMNLREVFKYAVKPFKASKKTKNQTYAEYEALIQKEFKIYCRINDKVFTLLKGKRLFQSFNMPTVELKELEENKKIGAIATYQTDKPTGMYNWVRRYHDWINEAERLSGFVPTEKQVLRNELLMATSDNSYNHSEISKAV